MFLPHLIFISQRNHISKLDWVCEIYKPPFDLEQSGETPVFLHISVSVIQDRREQQSQDITMSIFHKHPFKYMFI